MKTAVTVAIERVANTSCFHRDRGPELSDRPTTGSSDGSWSRCEMWVLTGREIASSTELYPPLKSWVQGGYTTFQALKPQVIGCFQYSFSLLLSQRWVQAVIGSDLRVYRICTHVPTFSVVPQLVTRLHPRVCACAQKSKKVGTWVHRGVFDLSVQVTAILRCTHLGQKVGTRWVHGPKGGYTPIGARIYRRNRACEIHHRHFHYPCSIVRLFASEPNARGHRVRSTVVKVDCRRLFTLLRGILDTRKSAL